MNTIVRSHIDHATGEVALEVDTLLPADTGASRTIRWRTRTSAVKLPTKLLEELQAFVDAQATALKVEPLTEWTAIVHRARDAEAAAAKALAQLADAESAKRAADEERGRIAQEAEAAAAELDRVREERRRLELEAISGEAVTP
jgi:hypothetical protein